MSTRRRRTITRGGARGAATTRDAEPIGEIMSRLLARTGYAQVLASTVYDNAWEQAAGSSLAQHSRAGNIRRGVLEVMVRNSTVLHELSFKKREILARLRSELPEPPVQDIRFRVAPFDM